MIINDNCLTYFNLFSFNNLADSAKFKLISNFPSFFNKPEEILTEEISINESLILINSASRFFFLYIFSKTS